MEERRTYTGWKASLLAIAVTFVVFAIVNLLAHRYAPRRRPVPPPVVVSVTPSR